MDSTAASTTQAKDSQDDWHSVSDAKKRKRIQDKLAQRARRKRLREAKKNAKHPPKDSETQGNTETSSGSNSTNQTLDMVPYSSDMVAVPTSQPITRAMQVLRMSKEIPYPMTVLGALYFNGQILGLATCTTTASKSSPAAPDVPLPLQPTPTQLLTVHFTGIDRFPFPKMRDNLINLSAVIDEEEFTRDIFTMPSFSITPGAPSWDPRAWRIAKPFAEKWGFLLN